MEKFHNFFKNKYRPILLFNICLGLVLRLYQLGKQSLWFDEAYSVLMSKNLTGLWFDQIRDASPPLYYTLLHYWMGWFGKDEFSLRFLSVLFGILLIPLIYAVGTTLFDKRVGFYASLLTAISPIHIYYSQEIKMYSLLPLLSLASFFMLYLCLKEKKNLFWVLYGLTTILMLYAHNYGIFLLIAEFCFYVLYTPEQKDAFLKFAPLKNSSLMGFVLAQTVILLAYLPRLLVISGQAAMDINPWIQVPTLSDVASTFMHFSLLSWRLTLTKFLSTTLNSSLPLFALIFLIGICSREKNKLFLQTYLLLPLGLAFCVSYKIPVYVAGRYDMIVFPAFCLILAVGLNKIKMPLLRSLFLIVILLSTSISLYHYYFVYNKSNDRLLARLKKDFKKSDSVEFSPGDNLNQVHSAYIFKKS